MSHSFGYQTSAGSRSIPAVIAVLCLVLTGMAPASPVGTAFTYQGMLKQGTLPANGVFDMRFDIYFSVDGPVAFATVDKDDIPVTDGIFTVTLDFGAGIIVGDAVWLQIGVRPGASQPADPYTTLTPRQSLTPAPYALSLAVPITINTATTNTMISISQLGSGRGLFLLQDGSNIGLQSTIANNANANAAILASTNGTGPALQALNSGLGRAGTFAITQPGNAQDALYAETAGPSAAVHAAATNNGTGVRGRIVNTGAGVHGQAQSMAGVGVKAEGAGAPGIALEIRSGGVKVSNAGFNTATPAFIHVANDANSEPCDGTGCFCYETVIDNPYCNNNPNAILIVTVNGTSSGGNNTGEPLVERVEYDTGAGRWMIKAKFDNYFCHGQKFNVLVINN